MLPAISPDQESQKLASALSIAALLHLYREVLAALIQASPDHPLRKRAARMALFLEGYGSRYGSEHEVLQAWDDKAARKALLNEVI